MKEIKSCGTHSGSFHADEVTAVSLLLLFDLIDRDKVYRTRDQAILSRCEYVCDTGGIYDEGKKLFDHHQIAYKGGLSSAGMILKYLLNNAIIDNLFYDFLATHLINEVDAHDNGVPLTTSNASFSLIIANFTPPEHNVSDAELDRAFFNAVDFAFGHLERLQARFAYLQQVKPLVKKTMDSYDFCLIFDEALPWIDNFFALGGDKHPAKFIIMPSAKHWKLRTIPPSIDRRMAMRQPLPAEWLGLRGADLCAVTGNSDAIFCHKSGFISIWRTKAGALKALEQLTR